ncbi:MAG: DUF2156 domain-containing protein [Clostridiales bacterium]|nr:DUF2156 domain-containing protein [Clostridiales bacterium]
MEFFTIRAEDKDKITKIIGDNPERICENTFGSMYTWSVNDEYSYCIENKTLYFGLIDDKKADFYFPIGYDNAKEAVDKLVSYCKEKNLQMCFSFLSSSQTEMLKEYFGQSIIIEEDRDWADYLYNYEDLLRLKGKKYHGQRNHINRFMRTYKNYEILPYDVSMHDETLEYLEKHFDNIKNPNKWLRDERRIMTTRLLPNYEKLGQLGAVLKVDNKIVAVTFGEIVGDTLYVHFEKATREYHGSYPMINKSFVKMCHGESLKYINREEDLGEPGLRTAKLSLQPCQIIPKSFAKVIF